MRIIIIPCIAGGFGRVFYGVVSSTEQPSKPPIINGMNNSEVGLCEF